MILKYSFKEIAHCNMCGSPVSNHKVMGKRLNHSQGIFPKRKKGITVTVVKCSDCGLVYADPQPIPSDIQDHYGVSPESYWIDSYFKIDENYFKEELNTFEKLATSPGRTCLDIGAGLGKCIIAMEQRGYDVYGFEPSKTFYEQGLKRMNMKKEKYSLNSMENAEYPNDFFDFITFGAVLEHLDNPSFYIDKALKWLKSDGLLHIEVPSTDWLTAKIVNFIYRLTGSDYVSNISPMHTPYHLYEFTLKSFKQLSIKNGAFKIAHHEYYVCPAYTYLPKILSIFTVPVMKYTNTGMQLCVWLRKN